MKKNNVAIDFINFGEIDGDNTSKLTAFVEAINSSDNSHLATIPPGPHLLSDLLITTPILGENGLPGGAGAGGEGSGEGGGGGFEFGVDPSLDPELALALRMSMEEEKARVDREKKEKEAAEAKEAGEGSSTLEQIKEEDERTPLLKDDKKDGDHKDDKMDTD